jgi:2-succinyl-5-enolpyruvyl-6-hydroxy-3-cyclohexene-1-carboxylate synthase
MAVLQPLIDLAEICYAHGIRHAVISPGSRSAALTLAFTRHEGFELHVVMDERSAGFIALGMAQQLGVPVVLICTSGSAAYNYAPAIAEAYFQQIPLLILTADRPKEWVHQLDGQTIHQTEIYGKHVRKFFELPADYAHKDARWMINRSVNDAILTAGSIPPGPVHINVPIREPFYPADSEDLHTSDHVRVIRRVKTDAVLDTDTWHGLLNEWDDAQKILIVAGQHRNSAKLNKALSNISENLDVPVVADMISNHKENRLAITHHDLFLPAANHEELRPDLLITYGLSLISKELKQFLRQNPAMKHWHIGEDTHLVDSFHTLTDQINLSPTYFFENLFEKIDYQQFVQHSDPETDSAYIDMWRRHEDNAGRLLHLYFGNLSTLNDLVLIDLFISSIFVPVQLHVANSMPIRYVNALGKRIGASSVFANRGTSGIDGCVSTAIGAAIVNGTATFLIVGDVAFLYDRNGLLINPLPDNLKILVVNNAGGNIFRMIDGPARLPELENYFETRHHFNAKRTSEDSGIAYFSADSLESLETNIKQFIASPGTSLLEVFTDPLENAKAWKGLKQFVRDNW